MAPIDSAIRQVNARRASIGAIQNRLEQTISRLNLTSENLAAAESRIRDADMAAEMIQLTKHQILQQSGTAMLAHANQARRASCSCSDSRRSSILESEQMTQTANQPEPAAVTVPSQALGTIEIAAEETIRMCEPLAGFPDCTSYALLDHVREDGEPSGSVYWLQSVEQPFQSFVVTNPWGVMPDYAPEISDADAAQLELRSFEDARVFAILTVPSDADMATINLRAPIIVNTARRLAKQAALLNDEYHTRHRLNDPAARAGAAPLD